MTANPDALPDREAVARLTDCLNDATKANVSVDTGDLRAVLALLGEGRGQADRIAALEARLAEKEGEAAALDPVWPNAVTAMLDRFDRAKGKGGYPSANEREAMRRCLSALHTSGEK